MGTGVCAKSAPWTGYRCPRTTTRHPVSMVEVKSINTICFIIAATYRGFGVEPWCTLNSHGTENSTILIRREIPSGSSRHSGIRARFQAG